MTDPQALAKKIAEKAADSLFHVKVEMVSKAWPADFRKIMWQAIADTATAYANDIDQATVTTTHPHRES